MKNSIKIAFIASIAAAGIAACTSAPAPEQNSAPVTSDVVTPNTTTSTPPAATPPVQVVTEVVTATVTGPPQAIAKVDNRLGYGGLKLGMSLEEARAAGLTDLTWDEAVGDGCVTDGKVAISKANGVERITLPADARTSKGIGIGSTFGEVQRAYPGASEYRSGWSAKVADNAYYHFIGSFDLARFGDADKIQRIKLVAGAVNCSMADL